MLLWLIGMFSAMDWLPADVSDHWLHFVLGLGMIGLGFALGRAPGAHALRDLGAVGWCQAPEGV